jgi:predicted nucleic acid-binding protein
MRLLVDTSAYSAFMRGHGEIKAALQEADEIFVNSIVLGELRAGFIKGRRRRKNDDELDTFLASPRVKLLDVRGNRRKIRGHSKFSLASRNADPYKRYLDRGQFYGAWSRAIDH